MIHICYHGPSCHDGILSCALMLEAYPGAVIHPAACGFTIPVERFYRECLGLGGN